MPKLREACRACGTGTQEVLVLGDFVVSDFVEPGAEPPSAPLTLDRCAGCGLVQLRHTVDRDLLYRRYWYWSGLNPSMVESLRDVAQGVEARLDLLPGDVVVDIGCNDGTLLSLYSEPGLHKVGFDPAQNLAEKAEENCDEFVCDYFESSSSRPRASVITSIAMFYDLDDPGAFVDKVVESLEPNGIWVVQMTDLVRMLRANAVDNVCHEHLCYYSLGTFCRLVERHGLEVFDVEFNAVNGGSLRAYVCHDGAQRVEDSVRLALVDERGYLDGDPYLSKFRERAIAHKMTVTRFVRAARSIGKRFHALGASTKGNTLLQFYGLTAEEIECAAEVNPDKFGRFTAGSNIPIVSQAESLARRPDFYLVLPWHFTDFLLEKHYKYLLGGGSLLSPLPVPTLHGYHAQRL